MEKDIFVLVEDVHRYLVPILPTQLSVVLRVPPLHVLPFFLSSRIKLVPQKFKVGFFFLLHLQTHSQLALGMTHAFEFLVDDVGISDVMHGKGGVAVGPFLADNGHFGGGELADLS